MSDRLLKESDVMRIAFQLPYVVNSAFFDAVKALPSADRPQGPWIDNGWKGDWQFETDGRGNCLHEYECSECGFHKKGSKSNYCPNCGADMRERKDFQVIVNGNCTKCGKPLSGNRIFICEECEEQNKESE